MKQLKKVVSFLLVLALTAAACVVLVSCDKKVDSTENVGKESEAEKQITVKVIDNEGKTTEFKITTKFSYLGDALRQENLIKGENGYIEEVNGLRADYAADGSYWSLSKGGEFLMTGADTTPISDGDVFEITYTV